MQTSRPLLAALSDRDLLATAKRLAAQERAATVDLIASIAEIDTRRLYLGEGFPSLFAYCIRALLLSEHAAYHRIEAARAATRLPIIFQRLADGSLTLTNVTLLARHLTPENVTAVLEAARGRSKREVERQAAALAPRPDVPSSVRKHPTPAAPSTSPEPAATPPTPVSALEGALRPQSQAPPASTPSFDADRASCAPRAAPVSARTQPPPTQRPRVAPLAADRYKVQFTVSAETVEKLRRLQDLMRHSVPDGDPAVIFDRALTVLLEQVEHTRFAATDRPRRSQPSSTTRSRHIPAAVQREVWARDGERCTFVGPEGRCEATGFLQFHHLDPYALGGEATADRIVLRCQAHNLFESEQVFGRWPGVVREPRTCYDSMMPAGPAPGLPAGEAIRASPTERGETEELGPDRVRRRRENTRSPA